MTVTIKHCSMGAPMELTLRDLSAGEWAIRVSTFKRILDNINTSRAWDGFDTLVWARVFSVPKEKSGPSDLTKCFYADGLGTAEVSYSDRLYRVRAEISLNVMCDSNLGQ